MLPTQIKTLYGMSFLLYYLKQNYLTVEREETILEGRTNGYEYCVQVDF